MEGEGSFFWAFPRETLIIGHGYIRGLLVKVDDIFYDELR